MPATECADFYNSAMTELAKSFEPAAIEARWAPLWEQSGAYAPTLDATKPSFSIQLPPPNVTGTLHMGHAFNQTIMDALTRYHRMRGDNTLWVPGTDHAGIATQIVVERQLEQQKVSRHDLGRKNFVAKVWEWKQESGSVITQQMRRMGASVDWSHEYFKMDDKRSAIVTDTFVQLYEQGLIYRGKRLVSWDPVLKSAVSDLEVESEEEEGQREGDHDGGAPHSHPDPAAHDGAWTDARGGTQLHSVAHQHRRRHADRVRAVDHRGAGRVRAVLQERHGTATGRDVRAGRRMVPHPDGDPDRLLHVFLHVDHLQSD